MKTKVKICGIKTQEAAFTAVEEGADFLGFIFVPGTKRYIQPKDAKKIGKKMKGKINLVGVFQNMPLYQVQEIIKTCNLDYGQFHGDESPQYIDSIKIKKIKTFGLKGEFNIDEARKQMKQFKVDFYLVDRIKQSEGSMLNLENVAILAKEFPLVFAGGLTPENVSEVIRKVKPKMVDVASGVETEGIKDLEKIKRFIKSAKGDS